MRFSRVVGYLVLGAILGVLLVYALGWRQVPVVAIVNGKTNTATFILRKGQVLKWESANGDPFSIDWAYGVSPCKEGLSIGSTKNIFTGVQTATCVVTQVPPPGVMYAYGIKAYHNPLDGGQTVPCYDCYYGSSTNQIVLGKSANITPPSSVVVSCAGTMASGKVIFDHDPTPAPNPGLTITWSRVGNIASMGQPAFSSGLVTCTGTGAYTCTFPADPGNYPITYTTAVTGTDGGQAPAYCGPNSIQGTGNGTITAPQPPTQ